MAEKITVKPGDTWDSIAARELGNKTLGDELAGFNGVPGHTAPIEGSEIMLPHRTAPATNASRRAALEAELADLPDDDRAPNDRRPYGGPERRTRTSARRKVAGESPTGAERRVGPSDRRAGSARGYTAETPAERAREYGRGDTRTAAEIARDRSIAAPAERARDYAGPERRVFRGARRQVVGASPTGTERRTGPADRRAV